jgi:hypothetical protein
MATITKVIPTGSTSGKPISVVAVATIGTTFHTAHATNFDEVYMYLGNTDTVDHKITVEFGGAGAGFQKPFIVPAQDSILAIAGEPLTGGLLVTVFDNTSTAKVNMSGYINRIS